MTRPTLASPHHNTLGVGVYTSLPPPSLPGAVVAVRVVWLTVVIMAGTGTTTNRYEYHLLIWPTRSEGAIKLKQRIPYGDICIGLRAFATRSRMHELMMSVMILAA